MQTESPALSTLADGEIATLVAPGGHLEVVLWDAATGRPLVALHSPECLCEA